MYLEFNKIGCLLDYINICLDINLYVTGIKEFTKE